MSEYGVFANVVATAGALSSAAAAVTLHAFHEAVEVAAAPEEALPALASRFAALLAMVVIALLYVFGPRIGPYALGNLTVLFFAIAIVALWVVVTNSIKHSYYYPPEEIEANRKLGGDVLTRRGGENRKGQRPERSSRCFRTRRATRIWCGQGV